MGELPGGADDSVETDEQTRFARCAQEDFSRGASDTPTANSSRRSSRTGLIHAGEGGRGGGRQPRRDNHRDGLDSYLRVYLVLFFDLFGALRLSGVSQDKCCQQGVV